MKKILVLAAFALVTSATPALAYEYRAPVQGPHCEGEFPRSDSCSFRYEGGQLYVGASVRGTSAPEGGAAVRLEARSSITGQRYLLLACATPGAGACAAGGSFPALEHLRKGQRLYCSVEGHGRGNYECGTITRR
ncbi:MAG: hypothetical protein M3345_07970 [Actinomycetota bacterium]|nr:hypothetical protein [Actinomycetota bacterium]